MDRAGMERLVSALEGRLMRAWVALIRRLRAQNPIAEIERRLHTDDPVAGISDAAIAFASARHEAYVAAGQAAARALTAETDRLERVSKKLITFDMLDPGVLSVAERSRLDLIREITTEQRILIRAALIGGAESGANPREIAQEIRDEIGLTEYQERIVQNYRRELERGQYADALARELSSGHSDRTIAAAVRNRTALSQAQIDAAVDRYRQNWIAFRAENIARTESLRIAHQGTEELYRQAIARGDVRTEQIERTWNTAHDPRVRSTHRSMDQQKRGFGETFTTGAGVELRFPADPAGPAKETIECRCVVSTRLKAA
ncbi:MAG TPA: phage minor head protein [Kofleriaceae bacterium]|nr:phage minor head protein [Kofleriaceae bacterium]